jgi:hypothetical protein
MRFTDNAELINRIVLDHEVITNSCNDATRAMEGVVEISLPDEGFFCVSDDELCLLFVRPTNTPYVHELHTTVLKEGRGQSDVYFHQLIDLLERFTDIANLITYVELANTRAYYSAKKVGFQEVGVVVAYSKVGGEFHNATLFQYPIQSNLHKKSTE